MKQTPIQTAIEEIAEGEYLPAAELKWVTKILQSLLPVERECIEGAYKEGQEDVEIKNNKLQYFLSGQDYFTSTYNNPQGGGGE